MKKLMVAVAALAWAGMATAGDYHRADTLKCSQCHTMHASRQHGFRLTAPGGPTVYAQANDKLLVQATVSETCLACHDGGGLPDVFGTANATQLGLRSAGALNGTVAGHTAGNGYDGITAYADVQGHTLETSNAPPGLAADKVWGTKTFSCDDCHAVHGNAGYRNLGPRFSPRPGFEFDQANEVPTYAIAPATDVGFDVTEDAPEQYNAAGVSFSTAGGANRMNAYCAKCHGNFHGDANVVGASPDAFKRHPTSGVSKSATQLLVPADNLVLRPSWEDAAKTSFQAACVSCHKGHGNNRAFGLLYPANGATKDVNLEDGDAAGDSRGEFPIRNLCTNCHPMGRS